MKYRAGFVAFALFAAACGGDDSDRDNDDSTMTPDARVDAATADGPEIDAPPVFDAPMIDAAVDASPVDAMVDAMPDAPPSMDLTETEPNEDGTPSTGGTTTEGNDFASAAADANGALQASGGARHILAAITPAGDEDVFAIHNDAATARDMRIDLYSLATGFGFGMPCDSAAGDTVLRIRDAAGVSLAQNDDRDGASDRCSGLTYTLAPGATVYAHVIEYADDAAIPAYGAAVSFTPVVCGDGVVSSTEQCDDHNMMTGDGCSDTCTLEGVTAEVEPNDTTANADASTLQIAADTTVSATLSSDTDVDTYRITVATGTVVRIETFTSLLPSDCAGGGTELQLLDAAGDAIIGDTGGTGGGIASCGGVVRYLAPGTYYAEVQDSAAAANTRYFLQVDFETAVGAESETAGMMGVNDTLATASANFGAEKSAFVFGDHTLSADGDYYAITVPAGATVRAEVVEGDLATTTCESLDLDSRLTIYDAAGMELADDDDDGRGFCSLIDGRGTSPLDMGVKNTTTAPATYYLQVRSSGTLDGASSMFQYRLSVTLL